jgi:hypothetical protein
MDKQEEKSGVAFMADVLRVSRQGYYKWLKTKDRPYKYERLLALMRGILEEDLENKNYGIVRMHEALKFKYEITESQRR